MLDQIKILLGLEPDEPAPIEIDKNLAAAALMVHVIAVDGVIKPEEEKKFSSVLEANYTITGDEARELAKAARKAQSEAVDLFSFTRVLKRDMNEEQRLALIEDLWEMVYADGQVHEFEDNVVWRVAELIGIDSRERMALKQRVLARNT